MAVPAYVTDLKQIFLDGGPIWTLVGGGRQTNTETDDFIQGTSCWSHDPFSTGLEGGVMNSGQTITAGDAIFYWVKCDIVATLSTHALGGQRLLVGNTATDLKSYYVRGSDDYQYGGWQCIPIDPTKTPSTTIGAPTDVADWFGAQWNVPAAGASKGFPMKVDAMRHGKILEVTDGDSGTPASWDSVALYDSDITRQWGICQPTNSGAALQGYIYWGTTGSTVYSRDSNRTIAIIDTEWTDTNFTQILFAHAGNDVVWDNVGLIALGTNNRGIINVTANGAITWTNSVFQDIDTTTLQSNSTFDGTTWIGCNEVTSGGGSLLGSKFLQSTVTGATSASLIWDETTDPDGNIDDTVFSSGSTLHHAIYFGDSIPSSITLRGINFTGFNPSNGQNNSTLYFADTTGTITVNLVGCTGTISYESAGAIINLVADPVTTKIITKDADTQNTISGVTAFAWVTNGVNFPYLDSVTITGATTTATVHHVGHGLSTNDTVWIQGTNLEENYAGAYDITVINDDYYSYTTVDTIATSPATGPITATFAFFNGFTDVNGEISDSRVIGTNQPFAYRCRKSTPPETLYVSSSGSDTVDSQLGKSITVSLISDE